MQLVQLVVEGDHSALVSVGTGHGKSVIIQLLADMLAIQGKKVVIVCLNSFLAFWGSNTYGSTWVN
jgi:replicative superfamily II helicase